MAHRRTSALLPMLIAALAVALLPAPSAAIVTGRDTGSPNPAAGAVRQAPCTTRTYTPAAGARFSNPQGSTAEQWGVMGPLIDTICSTPAGATIRVAVFSIGIQRFVDALIDAHRRGVHVQFLLDGGEVNAHWQRLAADLNTRFTLADRSFARTCPGSCLLWGDKSSLHTKLFMFSAAGRATAITVNGSANPTTPQLLIGANNSYTHVGTSPADPIYAAAGRYFTALAAAATDPAEQNPHYYRSAGDASGRHRLWFFPRAGGTGSADTVQEILDGVLCSTSPQLTSAVHIAMFKWTAKRRNVADKLVAMGRAGCRIDILWAGGSVSRSVARALAGQRNVRVTDTSVDVNGDGVADHYTHDKYWLIDGFHRGRRVRHVITGSPNFTLPSLRSNCEIMELLTSPTDYAAYLRDWKAQRARIPSPKSRILTHGTLQDRPPRVRRPELADS